MATKSKTRYAILGVLCMKPCSGYDIKKFCDKTISHFWNENFGHIYPVLKQLLEEQLIRLDDKGADERRKIYSITESGKREFEEWLVLPPEITPPRSELLLKLSFGNHMPKSRVIELLNEVKERNQSNLKHYLEMEDAVRKDEASQKDPSYLYWLASLRLGIAGAEANLRWSMDTIDLINHSTSSIDCSNTD